MRKVKKIKRKYFGTKEKPRLAVSRSMNNIYAQIIDDSEGRTLVSANSLKMKTGGNIDSAKQIGKLLAEKSIAKGIKAVVFDRGKSRFHGRVKALAEAAREGGLLF